MIKKVLSGALFLVCVSLCSYAQVHQTLKTENVLPLDPKVRYGKLPNGFTYYIRQNNEPENKILMSLVIKVGVYHEDKDQVQLAHFMEHMGLKGTKHFPNTFADLAKAGIKYVNGVTGSVDTRFDLIFASDNAKTFETGLQVMHDYAKDIQFNQEAINSEREVMLGEFRQKQSINSRISNQYYSRLYERIRNISNIEEEIRQFKPESLIRFYKDWYRPDLQAIIIVGDIQVDKVEQEIKSFFSDLKNPENPKERKEYNGVNLTNENQLIVVTDKEKEDVEIKLYIKQESFVRRSREDFKKSIIRELFNKMMTDRFSDISNQYNTPWNLGMSSFSVYPIPALLTEIGVTPNSIKSGFQAAIVELERVKRFGFSIAELSIAKKNSMQQYLTKGGKVNSQSLMDRYREHYVAGEAAPDLQYESALVLQLIKGITVKEVNAYIKKCINDINQEVVIVAPEKEISRIPNQATVFNWMKEAKTYKIEPLKKYIPASRLMEENKITELHGTIDGQVEVHEIGVTELRLSNGVRVVLKPFKPSGVYSDRILMQGFSPGGASLYTDEDYFSASNSAGIVTNSGIGALDKFGLIKYLSNKNVETFPYVKDEGEGINGVSAINNFETMMQLVYLYFTAPKKTEVAFQDWISHRKDFLQNWNTDLQHVFSDSIDIIFKNNSNRPLSSEGVDKTNLDKAFKIYQERFANAGDFTFVFTGDFNLKEVTPTIVKYLGSLPDAGKREQPIIKKHSSPTDSITKVFYTNQKMEGAFVELDFSGSYKYSTENNIRITTLCRLLNKKLFNRLRTTEGGVYFVIAQPSYNKYANQYRIKIEFKCAATQLEKLIAATLEEIENIKVTGPDAEVFKQTISGQKAFYKSEATVNDSWLTDLVNQYWNGEDPKEISRRQKLLGAMTAGDLKAAANEYLKRDDLMRFVMLPDPGMQIKKDNKN